VLRLARRALHKIGGSLLPVSAQENTHRMLLKRALVGLAVGLLGLAVSVVD
jgi:hypothetical protein